MSCLDVWVAAFDRLSDALEDYVACCQSINEAPPAAEEITGVDDSTGAPEYDRGEDEHPTEFADPEAYDAYLCGVAHRIAEKMDGAVDTVYDIILTTSNILVFATLVVLAFANVIGMGVAAVLAGGYSLVSLGEIWGFHSAMTNLRAALGGGDPQGLVPQTKAQLNAASDDIVDAIFCANDAPSATAALHAVFDAEVTSGSYRAILKLMFNGLVMRAAFAGFVNVPDRFDCTCESLVTSVEYLFDSDAEGWTVVETGTPANWEATFSGENGVIAKPQANAYLRSPSLNLAAFNRVEWEVRSMTQHTVGDPVVINLWTDAGVLVSGSGHNVDSFTNWQTFGPTTKIVGNQPEGLYYVKFGLTTSRNARATFVRMNLSQV